MAASPSEGSADRADRDLAARLTRLEESSVFTERTVETLGAEIAEINRRLREAVRRVGLIERRLAREPDADRGVSDPPAPR